MTRIEHFRERLAALGADGAVVSSRYNVRYLAGFPASAERPAFVVVGPERAALVVPGQAAAGALHAGLHAVIGYPIPGPTLERAVDVRVESETALGAALATVGLAQHQIAVEDDHLSARLAATVGRFGSLHPLGDILTEMRQIKDESEMALFRAANAANDAAFRVAQQTIRPGISELALHDALVAAIGETAGLPVHVTDPTNVIVSGPRTEAAVGLPTTRRLEPGDLVIIDLNPYILGYKADTTRTYCVGQPTRTQQAIHDSLVRALEAAEAIARPGTPAATVYTALIGPIVEAGFGAGVFNHGGHAIGLEHLERPYIIPGDPLPLAEGMLLTLEPGVYLPGVGGLRLEDNYIVRAGGLERVSHFPRTLTICG